MASPVTVRGTYTTIDPVGRECAHPRLITSTQTIAANDTNRSSSSILLSGSGCAFTLGHTIVYEVPLAAFQRLTVSANSNDNVAINIVDWPAANCLSNYDPCASSANATTTGVESATYVNGPAARSVFVLVGRATSGSLKFDISFTLWP
jgi:hypothetical protein